MKAKKKLGIVISVVVIGVIMLLFSSQPGARYQGDMPRSFGTINTSIGSPVLGSLSAPNTIIEFGDYQCPECKDWFLDTRPTIIQNLIETEKANLVFIDTVHLGTDSMIAAQATYCAEDQGKYWEYHKTLFYNQQEINSNWANTQSLKEFAFDMGLDMESFEKCLDSRKYEKKVRFGSYESKKNGITKTPTFVILDSEGRHQKIVGSQLYSVFEEIIDSGS